jgi:hypothetical protein
MMLRKRNGALDRAVECLAKSVQSIVNDPSANTDEMLGRSFAQYLQHIGRLTKTKIPLEAVTDLHRIFGIAKNDSERAEPDLSDTNAGMPKKRRRRADDDENYTERLSDDADADRDADESDDNEKDTTMKTLIGLAKKFGWQNICKQFVENGTGNFSETEVTEMLTVAAQKAFPGERPDVAFSKLYSAQTADGELMRRTTMAARDAGFVSKLGGSTPHFLADGSVPTMSPGKATLKPRSSGFSGKPAQQNVNNPRLSIAQLQALIDAQRAEADDDEAGEGGEHYEKLLKLAERAHAAEPEQTVAQHFEKIYTSREHAPLAMAERKVNRPRASW